MNHRSAFVTSADGVRVPRILYGTAWKKERTADLVEQAVRLGFRGIDTAGQPRHYDEAGVGEGLSRALGAGPVFFGHYAARPDGTLEYRFT